ncbi:polysaccharide pyruvyl transferase family protein [Priestia megaterium]|uniref:polysaccharide pyruvyl transferase family protein n=1 Tax=Priestia megaterium TaxID=1404 RepID=UPI0028563975|nr:polysaccharide pyruvyl transferase family protein [Priestia megaterium]MDR7246588.1 polysaccharide pyruvyl transferase WcaK-like protein [Priestia megaterium]
MYTFLTGAKKNAGDFLIGDRGRELLNKHREDRPLLQLNRWENLDKHLDEINKTKAIILCGGPAYHHNIFPNICPLVTNLADLEVPIIPFGLGWSGHPVGKPQEFQFSEYSLQILNKIHNQVKYTSCRDVITEDILKKCGFSNALMTGCPVWYDLKSIGKNLEVPRKIRRVVVTAAQIKEYREQNIHLLKKIKDLFPDAELYCFFHSAMALDVKEAAEKLNYHIVDASYDSSKLEFYRECDLHVGYRVHAHLFFLSIRKPSFLIYTDGRGAGQSKSFQLKTDVPGYESNPVGKAARNIESELNNGFQSFQGITKFIDSHYEVMKKFLLSLP